VGIQWHMPIVGSYLRSIDSAPVISSDNLPPVILITIRTTSFLIVPGFKRIKI
jgi:hypothetical protein